MDESPILIQSDTPVRAATQRYRDDIDGLRAIAVMLVVAYHALPRLVPGGFVGVDIFFVISGYLITGIISRQVASGNFSMADFYQKRIRRIFPALILVIAATLATGWFVLPVREFESLGLNIFGSSFFIQNFVLLREGGYFDIAANTKPLLHIWSLGIEEQYYIVWPLLLVLLWRLKLNPLSIVCTLGVLSFAAGILYMHGNHNAGFYLPTSRGWELIVGSALAIVTAAPRNSLGLAASDGATARSVPDMLPWIPWPSSASARLGGSRFENVIAVAGLALAGFAALMFNAGLPYPGFYACVPVAAAVALILSPQAWVNRHILSSRPMVFLGLISYPLYLWHFPLIAYDHILRPKGIPAPRLALLLLLSVVLAWLTVRFVEKPIRFGVARRSAVLPLLVIMALIGSSGLAIYLAGGLPGRMANSLRGFMLTGQETSAHWRTGKCLLNPDQGADAFAPECGGSGRRPLILLWGDSHAAAQYPGLLHFGSVEGPEAFDVAQFTSSNCPPALGYVPPDRPHCRGNNDFVIERIRELRPDLVVLHANWKGNPELLQAGLAETITQLRAIQIKKVVLLGPVPNWSGSGLSANVFDYYYRNGFSLMPERTTYGLIDDGLETQMHKMADDLGIAYISARQILCNQDGCLARVGKNGDSLTAFDYAHMTVAGSTYLVGALLPDLMRGVR